MSDGERQIEVIATTWDALESGDRERMRSLADEVVHPECEWTPLLSGVDGRTYYGPEGMVEFFEEWLESFSPRYLDRRFERLDDDTVLASCRLEVEGRETGAGVDREIAVLGEFDGDLLRRLRSFDSRAAALEAVHA